jgi:tape measure domain-containing protein
MAVANVDIRVNSGPAVAGLNRVNAASKATTAGVNGLKAAIAPLLGAFAAMQAAKFVFAKTAELESQTKSLEVLTGSVQKATQIIKELQQLGAVTPFTSTELIDAAKRLQAFGVQSEKVVETTRRLADVSGATGAELQGLVTAYGQVQAKGRLQGEELLQFQERGIGLQQELRKMYEMTGDEFQKALSKGRISAEAVEVAIVRLTNKGGKYANGAIAQSDTLSGKFSTLQDGIDQVARAIGTGLTPALKGALNVAIDLVTRMGQAFAAASITESEKKGMLEKATGAIQRDFGPFAGGAFGTGEVKMVLGGKTYKGQPAAVAAQMANDMINAEVGRRALAGLPKGKSKPAGTDPPKLREETDSGTKGKSGQAAQDKAANEAKRLAAAIGGSKSQLALTKAKFEIEGKMLQAQQDDDKALQIRLTAQGRLAEIKQQIADIKADKEMKAEQKLLEIQNQEILGLGVAREMVFGLAEFQKTEDQRKLDAVKAYLEKQYELNTSVQQQLQLADSVSGILGQGMTSAFDALIQGSEDFGKSLRNIASGALVDIAKQLIRIYIIEQAINSIKSFLTPFSSATPLGAGGGQVGRFGTFGPNYGIKQYAAGGTPPVGRPSLVGERGPELFMPGVRGSIIPNHALGGGTTNVVVNVDASGSSVQGDQSQAKALGNAISAAVQSELVKQKRPGGLLA